MPRICSRRTAVTGVVSFLALSVVAIAAAAGAPGTVSFTGAAYEIEEGDATALITLRRSGGADGAVSWGTGA